MGKEKVLKWWISLLRPEPHLLYRTILKYCWKYFIAKEEELGQPWMDNLTYEHCFPSTIFFTHLSFQKEQGTITTGILMQFFDVNHDSKSILRFNMHRSITFSVCLKVQPNYKMDLAIHCSWVLTVVISIVSYQEVGSLKLPQVPKAPFFKCVYKDEVIFSKSVNLEVCQIINLGWNQCYNKHIVRILYHI